MIKRFRRFYTVTRDNRKIIQDRRKINEEHEKKAAEMGLGWRVVASR
jgi:hypothetical protein